MNRYNNKILLTIFAIIALVPVLAHAREIRFEANVDKNKIAIGEKGELGLTFYGTQNIPAPDIASIDGFDIHYLGPSTMMTVINGKVSTSITHMYSAIPLRVGKFELGPFSFTYKGDSYSSNMVSVEVVEERQAVAASQAPASDTMEKLNLTDRIFLVLKAGKASAYVNELIPVTVKLYVNAMNVSDIQLPTFAQEGFSKIEFKEPKQYRENMGGLVYDVLEFNTTIFGTRPGDYRLGPAKTKCNVMVKRRTPRAQSARDEFFGNDSFRDSFYQDFFTRYERYPLELNSKDVPIVISPLPSEGMPDSFSGAVGDYQFIFNASSQKVKAGDPVTLTMEINGTGNFNTVLVPKLDNVEGFRLYEPQIQTESYRKTFKQVIIPETEKVVQTPRAVFTYFDPNKKEYKTITQGPLPIQVEKGKEEAPPQVVGPAAPPASAGEGEELKRSIVYIKESPGRFVQSGTGVYNKVVLGLFFAAPLLFLISFSLVQAKKEKMRRDSAYAGRFRAMKFARKGIKRLKAQLRAKESIAFYEGIFKALQEYLGNRLNIPAAGITSEAAVSILAAKNVDTALIGKMTRLFETCDQARFAFSPANEMKMRDDLKEFEEIVAHLERGKI